MGCTLLYYTDIKRTVRTLWADDRSSILLAIAVGWFLSLGVRLVYPVMLPHLRAEYNLTLTTSGLLLTVLWVAYALGQLPGGILADRIGEGMIMVVSTLISAATLFLVATARSPVVLYAATAMFGLGTALYGVARYTALSDLFPESDGTAIGLTLAAGDAGNTILPPFAGFIAVTFAWQYGFGFTIPLFVLSALVLWTLVPARTSSPSSAVDTVSLETIRYVFSGVLRREIVIMTIILILINAIYQSFTGFYPTYLVETKGLPTSIVTALFGLFFALGMVIQPVSGALYDRFGMRRTLTFFMGVVTGALALLPWVEGLVPVAIITVFVSFLLGFGAITTPYLTAALPWDMQGTGLGFLRTIYMTTAAGSPVLFGAIADRGFFDEVFLLLGVLAGVTIALTLLISEV